MKRLLETMMGRLWDRRDSGDFDESVARQRREHEELRAEREREKLLLRLSSSEYVDTLMKGVVREIRGG